ncbi:hypothetical protein [uncultured Bacteroides sp.]|uniref:hypothetical protein n=1 Tax=uncultured Bacteroides sp. TaxID=162156 RepID=UPI002AA70C84|nr:hypothetical protein [uncultured Bacteroides sp.]
MRIKLLLGLSLFAILAMDCISETDTPKSNDKITRIYVGTANAKSRTLTDASTAEVTWKDGDEIAVFHINGSGRSDYKRFLLSSGAGEQSAYFEGVTADDYLTAGETYKVAYPYSSVEEYDGDNNIFNMHANISASNNTDHLANHNWLVSGNRVIPTDGTMPSFSLAQITALAKIRLDIDNFTVTGLTNRRYLTNVNFTIADATKAFYNYIYWNEDLDVTAYERSEVATAGFSNQVQIVNNSSYYYWVPIMQETSSGIKQLDLSVHWRDGNNVDYSSVVEYTPKSMFVPGYIYNVHLILTFTENSGNSGILSLVE